MKSRAELDKEPRMMQFVVERGCPEQPRSTPSRLTLPIVVWVDLRKRVVLDSPYSCSAKQYVVPYEQAKGVRKQDGKDSDRDYRVCEHMGFLCE